MIDLSKYPEFLTSHHLVELGLYPTVDSAYFARQRGTGPSFIKCNRKILYTKQSLLAWMNKNLKQHDSFGSKEIIDSLKDVERKQIVPVDTSEERLLELESEFGDKIILFYVKEWLATVGVVETAYNYKSQIASIFDRFGYVFPTNLKELRKDIHYISCSFLDAIRLSELTQNAKRSRLFVFNAYMKFLESRTGGYIKPIKLSWTDIRDN